MEDLIAAFLNRTQTEKDLQIIGHAAVAVNRFLLHGT